jgi:hypothetical protein
VVHFLFHLGAPIKHLDFCINNILNVDSKNTIFLCTDNNFKPKDRLTIIPKQDLKIPDLKQFLKNDPNPLWFTALLRIFYLNAFLKTIKLPVVHFDNDVLCFYSFDKILKFMTAPGVYITPHKTTEFTFGYSYINDLNKFDALCESILNIINLGEQNAKKLTGDNIHEMRLLGYCGKDLITKLPVYPSVETYNEFIFDPSSYGQYIDGTPNGHKPNFIDPKQLVGSMLTDKDEIIFDKVPKLIHNSKEYNIFNLHVHTKNLTKYAL